jgi:hypothetical protein
MTLGEADYHITKPWMLEQDLYRAVSEFLAEWAKDQEAGFDLFHVVGAAQDRATHELRALLSRFNVPFHFDAAGSEHASRLLRDEGLVVPGRGVRSNEPSESRFQAPPVNVLAWLPAHILLTIT